MKTKLKNHINKNQLFSKIHFNRKGLVLHRVQRVMHSNVMTQRSMDVVFKRLSFTIQKGVAAQLVARLPTISM